MKTVSRLSRLAAGLLIVLGLSLPTLSLSSQAQAQTKMAVVDLQGAMMRTEQGMQAAASLKRYMQARQAELDRLQKSLLKEERELQKQAYVLSRRALQRRLEHFRLRQVEVQAKALEYNKQLQQKQANLLKPLMQKMGKVIRRVARKRRVDMVVDRSAVPYARADLDLTDLVVQEYNSGSSGGGSDKADAGEKPKSDSAPAGSAAAK